MRSAAFSNSSAFSRVSSLDRFRVVSGGGAPALEFDDLAVKDGLADGAASWYYFTVAPADSVRNGAKLPTPVSTRAPRILLSEVERFAPQSSGLIALLIGTHRASPDFREAWVRVYLERSAGGFRLRGWEH